MFRFFNQSISSYEFLSKFNIKTSFELPKFTRLTLNMSSNLLKNNQKEFISIIYLSYLLVGRPPLVSFIRRPESNFKTRKGDLIGGYTTISEPLVGFFLQYFFFIYYR